MLADITSVISDTGSNIRTLASHPDNLHARIDLTLEIADRKQLERIMANIRKISGHLRRRTPLQGLNFGPSVLSVFLSALIFAAHAESSEAAGYNRNALLLESLAFSPASLLPRLLLRPAAAGSLQTREQQSNTQPLDQAGMWSNSVSELRTLNVSNAEISELSQGATRRPFRSVLHRPD